MVEYIPGNIEITTREKTPKIITCCVEWREIQELKTPLQLQEENLMIVCPEEKEERILMMFMLCVCMYFLIIMLMVEEKNRTPAAS